MWFWWFILFCDLLFPSTMILGGWLMWKHTPATINHVCGYRVRRSMLNMDTWQFANKTCGRMWWRWGWVSLPITIAAHLPFIHCTDDEIGWVCMIASVVLGIVLLVPIVLTERELRCTFDDEGKRSDPQ